MFKKFIETSFPIRVYKLFLSEAEFIFVSTLKLPKTFIRGVLKWRQATRSGAGVLLVHAELGSASLALLLLSTFSLISWSLVERPTSSV